MKRSASAGFSLIELIVVLAVIAILISFMLPERGYVCRLSNEQVMLTNMRQLYTAAFSMAMDGTTTGKTNLAWPGDLHDSFTTWTSNLVGNGNLRPDDLARILAFPGRAMTNPNAVPTANTNAILVYAVQEDTPGNTVFLTSANFTNNPTGGVPPVKGAVPFGATDFVVFRKGGNGAIYKPAQVGDTNAIGSFVPLLK